MAGRHRGPTSEAAGAGGSKGVGLAVAGVIVTFFTMLPFVLVVVLYVFMSIYAIVRAIGPGSGENPVSIVVGFVLLTSVFAVLLALTIHMAGRSLTPRKRRSKP
jgi:uncharacterized membrane protein YjgN (DUF898 family)